MSKTFLAGLTGLAVLLAADSLVATALADGENKRQRRAPVAQPAQPAQQANWTGGQGGSFGGGSQMQQSFVEPGSNLCPGPTVAGPTGVSTNYSECPESHFAFDGDKFVATGGFMLGYRVQIGNFVVGVEGDIAFKNATEKGSAAPVAAVQAPTGGLASLRSEQFRGKHSQKTDSSFRARLGILVTPTLLAYATGGLALGEVCGSYSYSADLTGAVLASASGSANWCDTRVGYTVGGGLETEIAARWKARFEYRYTDLGSYHRDIPLSVTQFGGGACTGAGGFQCTGSARVDLDSAFHTFRFGIGYDF